MEKKCVENDNPINNGTTFVNATISLNVSNSTITINADENSKVIANNPGQVNVPINDGDDEEDKSKVGAPIQQDNNDNDDNNDEDQQDTEENEGDDNKN